MAKAVVEGVKSVSNMTVDLEYHIEADALAKYDAIIFGTPTYHTQMPVDFKNLFDGVSSKQVNLKNKVGSAFGSYGWSGEAPLAVIEILKNLGMKVLEPPVRAKYLPDAKALDSCRDLGKRVAQQLSA